MASAWRRFAERRTAFLEDLTVVAHEPLLLFAGCRTFSNGVREYLEACTALYSSLQKHYSQMIEVDEAFARAVLERVLALDVVLGEKVGDALLLDAGEAVRTRNDLVTSLPKLKRVGVGWANFLVMRRTHSTIMKQIGVDPKVVADQLGHTVHVHANSSGNPSGRGKPARNAACR